MIAKRRMAVTLTTSVSFAAIHRRDEGMSRVTMTPSGASRRAARGLVTILSLS
jgi:hypothetical protein